MKSGTAAILFIYLLAGCSNEVVKKSGAPGDGPGADAQMDGSVEKTLVVAKLPLPTCSLADRGMVGYVTSTQKFYVCERVAQGRTSVSQWQEISLQGLAGQDGRDGVNILVVREEFPANAECQAGGKRLSAVPDLNRNQVADANERAAGTSITSCNVVNQLVRTVSIPAGSPDCAAGGVKVLAGSDLNNNGALDEANAAEKATIQSSVVCNGVAGAAGAAGAAGRDGKDGKDGIAGRDGKDGKDGAAGAAGRDGRDGVTTTLPMASKITTLTAESVLPSCLGSTWGISSQFSPWILAMGPDSNRNGKLDDDEQPGAQFTLFCAGATYPINYRDINPGAAQFVTTATFTGNSSGSYPPTAFVHVNIAKGSEPVQFSDIRILRVGGDSTVDYGAVGTQEAFSAAEFTFRDSVPANGDYTWRVFIRTPVARVQREVALTVSSLPSAVAQNPLPSPASCPTPPVRGTAATVECPVNSAQCGGTVWGSGPYTDDSDPCKAAVHAGVISNASGGSVSVTPEEGRNSYSGSLLNGVNTHSWGSWGGSVVVSLAANSCRPASLDLSSRLLDNAEAIKSGGISVMAPLQLPPVSADNNTHTILHIFKNGQRTESIEYMNALSGIKQALDNGESFCALSTAPSSTPISLRSGIPGPVVEVRHEIPIDGLAGYTSMFFTLGIIGPNSIGGISCYNGANGKENSQYATVGDFKNAFGESLRICAASGASSAAAPAPGGVNSGLDSDLSSTLNLQPPAVDVAFVVDRSGSMGPQLRAVRYGMPEFIERLRTTTLPDFNSQIGDLRIHLTAYEDEMNRPYNPWFIGGPYLPGTDALNNILNTGFSQVNQGISDIPEGGILAIRETLKRLETNDSVKIIILVTDTYMHDGTGSQDQRFGGFSTLDDTFASANMKRFMLFSSSSRYNTGGGDFVDDTEYKYENLGKGTAQIEALREYYRQKAGVPDAYVGEEFTPVNNFNIGSLANLVAPKIIEKIKKPRP